MTNVIYLITELCHTLCIDRKEIIMAQIKTCENLSNCTEDKSDHLPNKIENLKSVLNFFDLKTSIEVV